MTVLFHASDLHFGRTDPDVAAALARAVRELNPDLAVLSGDFTQIGSPAEFEQAHDFIATLPCPFLAVPGNHDVPARNMMARLTDPFGRYRRFITDDLAPVYRGGHAFILGLNTARPALPHWNWANGAVSRAQINLVRERFSGAAPGQWKILVCHHPLSALLDTPMDTFVWRAGRLRAALRAAGVHLVMTGHIHHASVTFDKEDDKGLYHVGAASAISTRLRTQGNGYNVLRLSAECAEISLMTWKEGAFRVHETHIIRRNTDFQR